MRHNPGHGHYAIYADIGIRRTGLATSRGSILRVRFRERAYAAEELIAELCAAFLWYASLFFPD
jgi:hypothetical protein